MFICFCIFVFSQVNKVMINAHFFGSLQSVQKVSKEQQTDQAEVEVEGVDANMWIKTNLKSIKK